MQGTKKKDFNDTDLKFSLNIRVNFQTPESFFLGKKDAVPDTFEFDPRILGAAATDEPCVTPKSDAEVVVLVGAPGSGKSTLATRFPGYVIINQDTLKTKDKCFARYRTALSEGKSVVVDNQNKDVKSRAPYIDEAKKQNISMRAIVLKYPKGLCFHLNTYRMLTPNKEQQRDKVPAMIIHSYFKNMQPPTENEGFSEVVELTVDRFEIDNERADVDLMKMFLE